METVHTLASRHSRWLSNSWLVWDRPGGAAVLIDTGAPREPLLRIVAEQRLDLQWVLCTHHHHDHVEHNAAWQAEFGCPICGHRAEAERFDVLDRTLDHGEELRAGELVIRALHVPGHTQGQLSFLIGERDLFTGDTLFRGSVGGTRAPGHGTFEQLRESILGTLLALPGETRVHPGHMESTTVAREAASNPFVLAWSRSERPHPQRCNALGEPAELLLLAPDYDGGTKAWVRFDDGQEDIVPGSRVVTPADGGQRP